MSFIYANSSLDAQSGAALDNVQIIGAVNGTFVAVWQQQGLTGDGSGTGIAVRIFDAFGNALTPVGLGNTQVTAGDQFDPDLVALDDGGAALVYTTSGGAGDIVYERRDAAGVLLQSTFITQSISAEQKASVADFGPDGAIVFYEKFDAFTGSFGIFGKVVSSTGTVSSEFIIDNQSDDQTAAAAVGLSDGSAAVAYLDDTSAGGQIIRIGFVNPLGDGFASGGGNIVVTGFPGANVGSVDIAELSNGNLVLVWDEESGGTRKAFRQVIERDGTVVFAKQALFSLDSESFNPNVEATDDGFVVQYQSVSSTGTSIANSLNYYENDGSFQSGRGSGGVTGIEGDLDLAISADGRAVGVFITDGAGEDQIFGRLLDDYRTGVIGTPEDETLFANKFGGIAVEGRAGNDTVVGLQGDDTLMGGGGADIILGSGGDDLIDGGAGSDVLDYEGLRWAVRLTSQGVIDKNGIGTDTLVSELSGGQITNSIEHIIGDSDTTLNGGVNRIDGENSADSTFVVNFATQSLGILFDAGSPIAGDRLDFTIENFDQVNGTRNGDSLTGGSDADDFFGASGDDLLIGGGGNDFLVGQADADTLIGGAGDDRLLGGAGDDFIFADAGADIAAGGGGADTFVFETGAARLTINDFGTNDVIDLTDFRSLSTQGLLDFGDLVLDQSGNTARIRFDIDGDGRIDRRDVDGDGTLDVQVIFLRGFTASSLGADDFQF
ncbi:MAG: hypothetical protein AAGM84_07620 [Pseudomonadota bacterium]